MLIIMRDCHRYWTHAGQQQLQPYLQLHLHLHRPIWLLGLVVMALFRC